MVAVAPNHDTTQCAKWRGNSLGTPTAGDDEGDVHAGPEGDIVREFLQSVAPPAGAHEEPEEGSRKEELAEQVDAMLEDGIAADGPPGDSGVDVCQQCGMAHTELVGRQSREPGRLPPQGL